MKNIFFTILIFVLMCIYLPAQNSVPKHYELKGDAYIQADSILDLWLATEYPTILQKNKLKMTCAKCENIFMDVVFIISNEGSLIDYEVVKMNKCGQDFSDELKAEFVFFFSRNKFPPALRSMHIEFRLGTGLKC